MKKHKKRGMYLSMEAPALLLSSGDGRPAFIEMKLGDEKKKVPVAYFWKDAIRCGDYVHPITGKSFSVDTERLNRWNENFHSMRKAGVEIPIPYDHKESAQTTAGYVIDSKVEGDTLMLLHQVIGEDAAMHALRNRVSVRIDPTYRDSNGNRWVDVISHSSLTPIPVITGQKQFEPIAASRGLAKGVDIFELAAPGGPKMKGLIDRLREVFGADNLTEDEAVKAVTAMADGVKLAREKIATLEADKLELSRQLEELNLSRDEDIDPRLGAILSRSIATERELAVKSGAISPATAKALDALFMQDGKLSSLALSRAPGTEDPMALAIYAILRKNTPTPGTGTVTGVQLSRDVPGGQPDVLKPNTAVVDIMAGPAPTK